MRRSIAYIVLGSLAGGCATSATPPAAQPSATLAHYREASSSALAFDPPIDGGIPHPELARAGREPSAFMGFDQGSTEFYATVMDDAQTDCGPVYTQESVSVRTGVRSR